MNRLFAAIAVLFLSIGVFAQTPPLAPGGRTVGAGPSQLPAASTSGMKGKVFYVTDTMDCLTVISGTFWTPCFSTGAAWTPWGLWKAAGSDAYYTTGKVGIGTTTPKAKLDVTGGNILVGSPGQGIILKSPNGLTCRR